MRRLVTILLLFVSLGSFARKADMKMLDKALLSFDKVLVTRDSTELKRLLSDNLLYGHSNGWIQTKSDLIDDLFNGKLTYKEIDSKEESRTMTGNMVAVRSVAGVVCVMDGKELNIKLKVLQVWVWKHKHWELFARQSVRI